VLQGLPVGANTSNATAAAAWLASGSWITPQALLPQAACSWNSSTATTATAVALSLSLRNVTMLVDPQSLAQIQQALCIVAAAAAIPYNLDVTQVKMLACEFYDFASNQTQSPLLLADHIPSQPVLSHPQSTPGSSLVIRGLSTPRVTAENVTLIALPASKPSQPDTFNTSVLCSLPLTYYGECCACHAVCHSRFKDLLFLAKITTRDRAFPFPTYLHFRLPCSSTSQHHIVADHQEHSCIPGRAAGPTASGSEPDQQCQHC
jgi:hypothetical protein